MKRKTKLRIAGVLAILSFLMICNDPSLGVENYQTRLADYLINFIGVFLLGVVAYICHKDYEKYGVLED